MVVRYNVIRNKYIDMKIQSIIKTFILLIILNSCTEGEKPNTQNLPETVKQKMRDSIYIVMFDSLKANKKVNELYYLEAQYKIDTLNVKYISKYANKLGFLGNYNTAFILLNKSLKWVENKAKIYNSKSMIWQYYIGELMKNNKDSKAATDSALFYIEKACVTDTNDVEIFVIACVTHNQLGMFDKALNDIKNAIRIQPNNKDHILFRGMCKVGLQDMEGAYEDLKNITLNRKNDGSMYLYRGISEFYLKKYNEAKCDFDTSESLRFIRPELYYYRGCSKTFLNDEINGCIDIKKAHDIGFQVPADEYEIVLERLNSKNI